MFEPIKNLSISELQSYIAEAGIPKFRTSQIVEWVYKKGVQSYSEMTNLPKSMREQLADAFPIYTPHIVSQQTSIDGTRKLLMEFHDGALVETVGLPSNDNRLTACISSQSGCAMGCIFCATGKQGLTRNLYPGEIVDQVLAIQSEFERRVTNIVVMGQGEPFANYDNAIAGLRIINNPKLLAIGARHITISTCGVIEGIERLSEEPEQFTLAVSLHSAIQETRDKLIPAMKHQKLGALRKAIDEYTVRTNRRVTFEYALMDSINDSEEELKALSTYCKRLLCHVNLIPLNVIDNSSITGSSQSTVHYWKKALESANIPVTIRKSQGPDIAAACGQLAGKR